MESVVVSETLLDPDQAARFWPKDILDMISEQIRERGLLLSRFTDVAGCIPCPDIPIESAIGSGYVSERQVERLYDSLGDLLENPEYKRIILYLPFGLLPDMGWRPDSRELQSALERFRRAYMERWKELLQMADVRANFVDGDVLEVERRTGDLPRVVKAAHLVPKLIEKSWLTSDEVMILKESSDCEVLTASLNDALIVLDDLENGAAASIYPLSASAMPVSEIMERLTEEFSLIDNAGYSDMTERREQWLRQSSKEKAIDRLAEIVGEEIAKENIPDEIMETLLGSEVDDSEISVARRQMLIEGIGKAIEVLSSSEIGRASHIYKKYQSVLLRSWECDDECLKETLSKFFRHLYHLGIVDEERLGRSGIAIPELGGQFSKNLASIDREIDTKAIIAAISSDPELSELIYPIVLVFGSRLKGYGTKKSDIDVGIFFRPDVALQEPLRMKELLKKVFPKKMCEEGIIRFYLEEKDGIFLVRDLDMHDRSMGKSYWAHVLFGSAWIGDGKTIRELFQKLLVPHMYGADRMIHGMDARGRFLEHLERDNLQYRLMHKGYEKFHSTLGGIKTKYADRIDGKSVFWDPGYRILATELFIRRVFLPRILASQI